MATGAVCPGVAQFDGGDRVFVAAIFWRNETEEIYDEKRAVLSGVKRFVENGKKWRAASRFFWGEIKELGK